MKLGDHIQTQKGYAFKSKWYSDHGNVIVKVSDFTDDSIDTSSLTKIPTELANEYGRYRLNSGDVVIQTVGSWPSNPQSVVGKVIRVPTKAENALLNQNAVRIDPEDKIDGRYLFYLLKDNQFKDYIIGCARGAASQASITLDAIRNFTFELPPLDTQRKISAVLSAYDDLIENNTRRIAILEEMAQALYREWFVHFRFPGHEDVKMVEVEGYGGNGRVPEGWEIAQLGSALMLQRGFDLPRKKRRTGYVPIHAATGVTGYHDEAKVEAPGVLTGRSGSLGTVKYVDEDFWPLNTTLWVREFRRVTPLYAYYLLSSIDLEAFNSGAAVPSLNRNVVHKLPVVIPPEDILSQFDDVAVSMFNLMKVLRDRNANLHQSRDLLLPRLISGELDVSNLDIEGSN